MWRTRQGSIDRRQPRAVPEVYAEPVILAVFAVLVAIFVVLPLMSIALWFVITTAVLGVFLGALGRLIVPGSQPIGVMATILCGLVGSFVGGIIGGAAHLGHFATLLIEIGVAAGAVALWSGTHRRPIGGGGNPRILDV